MKHGKNPTREQKEFLQELQLDPKKWLVVKNTSDFMEIVHRETGERRNIGRSESIGN